MLCHDDGFYNMAIFNCYCATFDWRIGLMQVGACASNCGKASYIANVSEIEGLYHRYTNIPLDLDVCKYKQRTGTLCGKCQPNHYPLAYSFSLKCVECRHIRWNWGRYVMAAYLPLTLFCLTVLFLKINIASSHLHAVIFFCQGMSVPTLTRNLLVFFSTDNFFVTLIKTVLSVYGIWNLDFFRPFYSDICIGIGILPTLALDYAIAVYPLLLVIISYLLIVLYDRNYRVVAIMWRPFRVLLSFFKSNWNIRTSVIDSFSTFFLLSNIKCLGVSFDLLVPTRVYHLHGHTYNYTWALYISGDIEYFGREHLPYAILAIVMLAVFVVLPVAVLALYPFKTFHSFLNLFPFRWYILYTFVDSFQGCYKDGTEPGTRDCRWFSAVYFATRSLVFVLFAVTLSGGFLPICTLLLLLVVIIFITFKPYKSRFARHFQLNTIFLVLYAMVFAIAMSIEHATIAAAREYLKFLWFVALLLAVVPLITFLGLILYRVFSKNCCLTLAYRLCGWYKGYASVGGNEDADAYCDRVVNPQEYHIIHFPDSGMADYSTGERR
jgi:hypothetical protein